MLPRLTGLTLLCLAAFASQSFAAPERARISQSVLNTDALQPGQQAVVAVVVDISPGFHSQSHSPIGEGNIPFTIKLDPNPSIAAYDPIYPAGLTETYPVGTLNVYTGKVTFYIPIQVARDVKPGPVTLSGSAHWQICDQNVCYFPETKKFTIDTKIVPPGEAVKTQNAELFKGFDPKVFSRLKPATGPSSQPAATQPSTSNSSSSGLSFFGWNISHNSYALAFFAAFIAGIMFNAVPCVLPVLPLKAIGFYEVSQHNRLRSISYGAVFSAGLIASFSVLGLIVLVRHYAWGQIYTNVWFNAAIVLMLLIFAIGTFGFFTVNVPTFLYNVSPRHDTYLGNFLYGIFTAILSTPCTFGLFLGLLVWASEQPPAIGVALVNTVGAGMALPYFLLSAFPGIARKLPRSGPWAELVKQEMAFLLLGSAVFFARRFIQPVLGPDGFWWLLFAVTVFAAVFLVARTFQFSSRLTARAVATILAVSIIGGALALTLQIVYRPYEWTPYTLSALTQARDAKRLVVVEFTATWCPNCQYVETHTLHSKPIVQSVKLHDVEMLKADLTTEEAPGWSLLKQIHPVAAIPFTAVYGPASSDPIKLEGIYSPQDLQNAIDRAATRSIAQR